MTDFRNRIAVVTGANRGLGAGLARAFIKAGLRVAGLARGSLSAESPPEGEHFLYRRVDVRAAAAVERFAEEVAASLGPIDLWVNNAGVLAPIGMARDTSAEEFAQHISTNVCGVFNGSRAYLRHLRETGRHGALVNISSGAAHSPYRGWSAYCAGKAAVDQLTRVLAEEEGREGVRIFALAPGIIETEMQAFIRSQSEESFPDVGKFIQMFEERALSPPEAPAEALLRLALDPSSSLDSPVIDIRGIENR
ncbi:MAG: hypothetical protein CME06_15540 [Gemmatimonadetes bacterium]|nr:hypothetical protein [Gemmatimonadota bacterium]